MKKLLIPNCSECPYCKLKRQRGIKWGNNCYLQCTEAAREIVQAMEYATYVRKGFAIPDWCPLPEEE